MSHLENESTRGGQEQGLRVVRMPEREALVRKFQGLGVLGVSEQSNRFWSSLAKKLDRAELNDAGLVFVWETTLNDSLGAYGPVIHIVGMHFDRVVDAITPDQEFASSAKEVRRRLMMGLQDLAKAAEPKLEDLGQEDSLEDFERFKQARRIADIVYEYIGTDLRHTKNDIGMIDRRDEEANPYYNQTHRGFFLEASYGQLHTVWTPWGKYSFGGSGISSGNAWEKITPAILERFGATVYRPEVRNEAGVHGPVYALHRIDDAELPDPVERPRSQFRASEDVDKTWKELRKRYFESKGEATPLTGAEKWQLDKALLDERSKKEPPINENDIRNLWELAFQRGKVVKYTRDGGKTWRYTKIADRDPVYFKGGNLGFHADEEVLPNAQVHASRALTEDSFQEGMVVRQTTAEEIEGMKFSYDFSEDAEA